MLAQRGDVLNIELIERHDAVDPLRARRATHRMNQLLEPQLLRHVEEFIDGFPGPVGISQFFGSQQEHSAALILAGTEKFLAFLVRADAENCAWMLFVHGVLRVPLCGRFAPLQTEGE